MAMLEIELAKDEQITAEAGLWYSWKVMLK